MQQPVPVGHGVVVEISDDLAAGPDGLVYHRRLAREAGTFLKPGGHLIAEIGLGQDTPLRDLYAGQDRLQVVAIEHDLAGIPRVLIVRTRP